MGFQSPRGDFGFLKNISTDRMWIANASEFQSPRGDFGFLKKQVYVGNTRDMIKFQSPRGDFGFLKTYQQAK